MKKKIHYDKETILRWVRSACGIFGECTKDKSKVTCKKCIKLMNKKQIKEAFKTVNMWNVPVGTICVNTKDGLKEFSELTDKQFIKAFGCTRKEFCKIRQALEDEIVKTIPRDFLRRAQWKT